MITVASIEAMIRECTSSQIDRCCAGEAQQSRVLISVGTGSGTREWLTLDPYRPVRGDPRLRAVISPSDPDPGRPLCRYFQRDLASRTLGLFREPLWLARVE